MIPEELHNELIKKLEQYFNGHTYFVKQVINDAEGNIICAGFTNSEGAGSSDALVIKFDTNLNILTKKRYSGSNNDYFYSVTTDSSNNIICTGYTISEGAGTGDALVVKFDSNLNIITTRIYSSGIIDCFYNVIVDSSDNIICVGRTTSEKTGNISALIVKFNDNVEILAKNIPYKNDNSYFKNVVIDQNNDIVCTGYIFDKGGGTGDVLVIKFDLNLNIIP